jgi:hypothetical protein
VNAAITARCRQIARKAESLATLAEKSQGNTVADGGRELATLAKDLCYLTDALGDDAWKAIWLPDGPPF